MPPPPHPKPTADLCDLHADVVRVADAPWRDFGRRRAFAGEIATVHCPADNGLVRARLSEPGRGRVLVVDGGGARGHALLGDALATLAAENGWSGIVVNGCVRDSASLADMDLGIKALGTSPRKTVKRGLGSTDVALAFAGVVFEPGHWLCADADGVITAPQAL